MGVKINILVICLLQSATTVSSQPTHINFTALTAKDGLLSNSINAILKDKYGLMWFGTDDGLNKFDGTNFTVYRHRPGDSSSLRANEILALHEDRSGSLWIGTSGGGISLYDRKKDRFVNFPADTNTAGFLPNAVVRGICSDYLGNIWIAQYASAYVLDRATHRMSRIDMRPYAGLSSSPVPLSCIFEDSRHRMWIGTDKGLFLYLRDKHSFRPFRQDSIDRSGLYNDHIRACAEDKAGHLWVGTEGGLYILRPDGSGFIPYTRLDDANPMLDHQTINAITTDKDGLLWVATMEGLYVLDPHTGHSLRYMPDEENIHSLTDKAIRSIYIDNEGIYWVGTYRGGINKYDKNLNLFNVKLGDAFHNKDNSAMVTSFAERGDGKVWVGTDGDGLYVFDRRSEKLQRFDIRLDGKIAAPLTILTLKISRNGKLYIGTNEKGLIILDPATGKIQHLVQGTGSNHLNARDIYCIGEDSKGQIWLGFNGAGINVLKDDRIIKRFVPGHAAVGESKLPLNGFIRAIEEDRDGNMWIGSHGGGLGIYHPQTGQFTAYDQNGSRLPSDKIYALLSDSQGRMWIGTYGGGLSLFDKKSGQFTNFSEPDGLQNSTIYQIVEDRLGQIWVSTNTGISSFDVRARKFRNYTSYNGLQNNNFIRGSGTRLSDGELFFGGLQGFNYFDPADLTANRNVPKLILTDLKVSNESVVPGNGSPISEQILVAKEIRLAYKQNFALSFVALNYTLPRQNHYAYKLEGFDKDWNYAGSLNTAYYTNLDPGEYIFRVKASNNDGVWSTGNESIRIFVKPPFWRTIYAFILYFLAAAGLWLYSRHRGFSRLRRKFELEQERQESQRVLQLDRLKLKFLTNISHEFRTPISLIMGPVDQLLTEQKNEKVLNKLLMVKRNARRLLNLVNQLLDFRKMEEQELKLQLSEGEFVAFVGDVCHSFTDLSERKHIDLAFDSRIPRLYALFDKDKIERILFNLLSNAFKFTLEGGKIAVTLQEQDGPAGMERKWVAITVLDTGIGIPADKQERIFDRLFQTSPADAVLNQGTGIGLSITKEFVRMHGGSVRVDSEPGHGSIFTVSLPLTEIGTEQDIEELPSVPVRSSAGADESDPAEDPEKENGAMPVILLVEDNEDFRFYLKDNLRGHYKVIEAINGKEGWQKALAGHPKLIVSDISMPYMDGIALTRKLKGDKRTSHIPVILLTALTGDGQQLQGLETGANDYITKPFSVDLLHAKIKNLLELGEKLKTVYSRQIRILAPEVELQSDDEKLLQKVVRYLEENMTNSQLSVASLSKQAGMSRSSLYSKLLEITGETPVEYIRSFKLDKAAVLLEKSDMTIAEIAYQVGFSTPNYFAKAFKARFDILPSEYAARNRKVDQNSDF